MFIPARRLDGIAEYYFAAKLREIADLRQQGHPIINLGIGSPDLPPAPSVVTALANAAALPTSHGYQSYTGVPALRRAWADWYARHYGVAGLNPDNQVLPLIGSKEGIVHIAMTFLEAGDEALVPNPGYPTYRAASLLAGAEVRYYDLDAAHGWQPDLAALEKTDLSRVKIMWVNYPHMPTGAPGSTALFEQLVAFGKRHNILIVNDNPYSFILNPEPRSILSVPGAEDVAIELNSLSKSQNMAGWRVGALLGNAEVLRNVLRFKSNMDSGQFLPMQLAAVEALGLDDSWYSTLNDTYRARQAVAFDILAAVGCVYNPQQQGLFVWAKIPDSYADGYAVSDELLYSKHVFITPGGIFGSAGERYVRISLCQEEAVLRESLGRLTTNG
jgi:aspartate/methionine/tyrosine aminotransferase